MATLTMNTATDIPSTDLDIVHMMTPEERIANRAREAGKESTMARLLEECKSDDSIPVWRECPVCHGNGTLRVKGWLGVREKDCAECAGAGRVVAMVYVHDLAPIRVLRDELVALRKRVAPTSPMTFKCVVAVDTAAAEKSLADVAEKAKETVAAVKRATKTKRAKAKRKA